MELTVQDKGRLDVFLHRTEPDISRVQAGQLVRGGCVLVNGRVTRKPAHVVRSGDTVSVTNTREPASETHITPVDLHLPILFEDSACLVIAKPAGIAVHPAPGLKRGEPTLLHGIAFLFRKKHIPFSADSVLVHRLDRETTGCVLIAKSKKAHAFLQKQFAERSIAKRYLAIVAGIPDPPSALIDAPLGRNLTERTKMSVLKTSVSREARTTYHTLQRGKHVALLACDLHTGRTHQIRVHLASVGHPLLGDGKYASSSSRRLTEEYGIENLCLHAWQLTFRSSADDQEHTVRAPPPEIFLRAVKGCGISIQAIAG
ncbi:MAG: RluA family pseudouridine synthase [Candidatus Peregrinibacteria bacterium]